MLTCINHGIIQGVSLRSGSLWNQLWVKSLCKRLCWVLFSGTTLYTCKKWGKPEGEVEMLCNHSRGLSWSYRHLRLCDDCGIVPNWSKRSSLRSLKQFVIACRLSLPSSSRGSVNLDEAAPFCMTIPREELSSEASAANTPASQSNEQCAGKEGLAAHHSIH